MRGTARDSILALFLLMPLVLLAPARADVSVQCPASITNPATGETNNADVFCKHLSSGDGFVRMGDGYVQYMFGFKDVTATPADQVMSEGMLAAEFAAPTLTFKEGKKVYLTLTNVGMTMRPDLFDPHTVHWHGFPFATPIFDGEPMASISINMGSSLTYFYVVPEPGTYMYHCHVEATEHMQMGMLGNLYVTPKQDGTAIEYQGRTYTKFAYNDGDGSTGYDIDFPVQLLSFDPRFHDQHINVQPLPFADMKDTYPMINGRGYPDTISLAPPIPPDENGGKVSQPINALITATQGQRVLLRISSLSTVDFFTVRVLGIPMQVVGKDAKQLKGPSGTHYFTTNSLTLGGGESYDVLLDTTGIAPGTYFLYTTNLNQLSNDNEDFGGMMTEIVIN